MLWRKGAKFISHPCDEEEEEEEASPSIQVLWERCEFIFKSKKMRFKRFSSVV